MLLGIVQAGVASAVCGDDPNNTDNDNNEGCRLGTASSLWSLGSLPGEGFQQPQTRRHGAVPHSAVSTPAIHLVYNHFIGLQSPLHQPGSSAPLQTRIDNKTGSRVSISTGPEELPATAQC